MSILKTVSTSLLATLLLLAPMGLSASPLQSQPTPRSPEVQALHKELQELASKDEFAGAVLIGEGDEVVLAQGFGLADRESAVPFTADTVSTIGSITKQFTGAAVLKLHEQGKLELDSTLGELQDSLPDDLSVPEDKQSITLHQLLTHTAGFRDGLGNDEEFIGRQDYLRKALASTLLFTPGERHEYSNVGYSILAAVIELRSEQSYEDFLNREFFTPLKMTKTGYTQPAWGDSQVAVGYRKKKLWGTVLEKQMGPGRKGTGLKRGQLQRGKLQRESGFSWHLIGNGGIHSTTGDLFRWVRALRNGSALSQPSLDLLFGEHADEGGGRSFYGYGWVTFHTSRGLMIGHNGGNDFFFADLNFVPGHSTDKAEGTGAKSQSPDRTAILLTNDAVRFEEVSDRLVRYLLDLE